MQRKQRQLQPIAHPDLVVDATQVILDHLLLRPQLIRNVLVLAPLHDKRDYLLLFTQGKSIAEKLLTPDTCEESGPGI